MLIEKLDEEEISFMEDWHSPICLTESLFSNFDNLSEFNEDRFGEVRLYQQPFISNESIIDFEGMESNEKKRFELRKNVGDIYNYGARKFGKTLITEKLDVPLSMFHDDGFPCIFTSIDAIHLRGVLDAVKEAMDSHPILKMWKKTIRTAPSYRIEAKNGWLLEGVNMNVASKAPGQQFYGKHAKKLWIEEASLETERVFEKRKDALSEVGAVMRCSGMTNFTKYMPAGKAFCDPMNRKKIINLPQFVNPFWDEKEKEDRLKEYGGESSVGFRVFVKGEVVESGVSEFDMSRVRECYNYKKQVKKFEISKEKYSHYKNLIVVERPKNADRIFIAGDIGESAGTDLVILSEVGEKYNYLYNINLYDLTDEEQFELIKWLAEMVEANVIGIDCGDGTGRAVYRRLEKIFPKENLVWYAGTNKINIGFKKDDKGKVIIKKGEPEYLQEFMSEWSVRRLKTLLYNERINLPLDYSLDAQLNSVVSMQSGNRTVYACISSSGDHLFDAFKVFAISQWLCKDFNQTKPIRGNWGVGAVSW